MLKKLYPFLLFILGFNCFSQKKNAIFEIDSLLTLSDHYINKDFGKSLGFAEKALSKAQKLNDSQRKFESYYYIVRSLVFFRDFQKSSKYIDLGLQDNEVKKDPFLHAQFLTLNGVYYSRMSLVEKSFQSFNKALALIKSNDDLKSRLTVAYLYMCYADYYTEVKNYKLAAKYSDASITAIEKIPVEKYASSKRIYQNKSFIYFYKSWLLLEQKKTEEAYPFIQKAYNYAKKDKIDYMALFYEIYGDYYFQKKDFRRAIEFYLKAVDNKKKFRQASATVDSKISLCYKALRDDENEMSYLKKAEYRRAIDQAEYNDIYQNELSRVLAQEKIKVDDKQTKSYIFIFISSLVFVLLLIILIVKNQKIRKKKIRIIKEQMVRLTIKDSEIDEKSVVIDSLQQRVNNSFAELSEMVTNNDSKFWGRFQEIHPEFLKKMLELNSNLKVSELIFCSYIYLGFTSKEIAIYTFKAIRTIENNRYNLRKKLGLNSSEDFTIWIRRYIDN